MAHQKPTPVDLSDPEKDHQELKRKRVDSEPVSPASKFNRVESVPELSDADVGCLFNILGDLDNVDNRCSSSPELDSVVKSLQKEIHLVPQMVTSDELVPRGNELGYLLEASDDELGLPPRSLRSVDDQVIRAVDLEPNGFDGQIWSTDLTAIGIHGDTEDTAWRFDFEASGDCVAFDGLFDHTDITELTWRQESLPAL